MAYNTPSVWLQDGDGQNIRTTEHHTHGLVDNLRKYSKVQVDSTERSDGNTLKIVAYYIFHLVLLIFGPLCWCTFSSINQT